MADLQTTQNPVNQQVEVLDRASELKAMIKHLTGDTESGADLSALTTTAVKHFRKVKSGIDYYTAVVDDCRRTLGSPAPQKTDDFESLMFASRETSIKFVPQEQYLKDLAQVWNELCGGKYPVNSERELFSNLGEAASDLSLEFKVLKEEETYLNKMIEQAKDPA